jgi:5-methylcytosine-specific restriction enzyme A
MSPTSPPKPCAVPRCPELVSRGSRCDRHRKQATAEWEARSGRGGAAARGYDAGWRKVRAQVLADRPWCQHPGCERPAVDVHHIFPKRDGGPDRPENLLAYCHSHHSSATSREKWKRKGREMTPAQTYYRPPMDEGPRLH